MVQDLIKSYKLTDTFCVFLSFRLIRDGKGTEAVELLRKVSVERRNVKQNPLIFALALCARSNDLDTKEAAYKVVNEVCRIPTHLFMFIKFCEQESEPSMYMKSQVIIPTMLSC